MVDTSDLPLRVALRAADRAAFRRRQRGARARAGSTSALISFAFPAGLPGKRIWYSTHAFCGTRTTIPYCGHGRASIPRSAPTWRPTRITRRFSATITSLLSLLLPRFVQEGKKYSTIAIGCTGGRHRSVHLVERLAALPDRKLGGARTLRIVNSPARRCCTADRPVPTATDQRTGPRAGSENGPRPSGTGGLTRRHDRRAGTKRPKRWLRACTRACAMIGMILVTHGRLAEELRHRAGARRRYPAQRGHGLHRPGRRHGGPPGGNRALHQALRYRRRGGAADRYVRRHAEQSRDLA